MESFSPIGPRLSNRESTPTPVVNTEVYRTPSLYISQAKAHPYKRAEIDAISANNSLANISETAPMPPSERMSRLESPVQEDEIELQEMPEPPQPQQNAQQIAKEKDNSKLLEQAHVQKLDLAAKWLRDQVGLYNVADLLFIYFWKQHSPEAKPLLLLGAVLTQCLTASFVLHKMRPDKMPVWKAMTVLQIKIFYSLFYISFKADFYTNENAGGLKVLANIFELSMGMKLVVFYQHNILLLEIITSEILRKRFMIFVYLQVLAFYIKTYIYVDVEDDDYSATTYFAIAFAISSFAIANSMFTYIFYNIQTISFRIMSLQQEDNEKYKFMFGALKDSLMLVKDRVLWYKNKPAAKIIDKGGEQQEDEINLPLFYKFVTGSQGPSYKAYAYSINELIDQDFFEVGQAIFTDSKEVAEAKQMDQVKGIIESKSDEEDRVCFYQVKLIRIESTGRSSEEVMIQIQDITLRIQSHVLRVERQYMSIMNSTVSHEMRNPLNAIVSQISKQRANIDSISKFVSGLGLSRQQLDQFRPIENEFSASLRVSESSSNLIRFNVEDILALPQLKAGKFTKNIQEHDLRQGVLDIAAIMKHQAQAKLVHLKTVFEGFPPEEGEKITVSMDLQRFQQVVLNFLSNALKFTEKRGKITILVQYVQPMSERERELGMASRDDKAETILQKTFDAFYGEDYLADSDSDEDENQSAGSDFSTENMSMLSKEPKLLVKDKYDFRAKQRGVLNTMLTKEQRPKILLSLIDSGIGIKVADQMKLFQLFGTIKSSRKVNTKGVGLGLSITKMIAEEFGGTAVVHSKKGRGSTFQASLSLITDSTNLVKKSKEEEQLAERLAEVKLKQQEAIKKNQDLVSKGVSLPSKWKKILVVDDEAYNTEVLEALLVNLGVPAEQIVSCLSGKEALEILSNSIKQKGDGFETDFSTIFTDLSMPMMDGYRFARKARSLFRKWKIAREEQPLMVALTGHTESEFFMHAFARGIDQVYSKPVRLDEVKQVLLQVGVIN